MNQKESSQDLLTYYQNRFSHIYIEEDVTEHHITKKILSKFPESKIIEIVNYKNVFNRSKQDFLMQKRSPKLILAKKRFDYIYKGSPLCEDFGETNFYYTSSIMGCIYNCEYCYLKGMYQSGNIVVFVNIEDFFSEIEKLKDSRIYLCISYDSDILALEGICGFTAMWVEFARENPNVLIEVRTKSANFKLLKNVSIPDNIIFAWTLSPREIIGEFEHGTPGLDERMRDIKAACELRCKIRISMEPVMKIHNFEIIYSSFIKEIFNGVNSDNVRDINIGTFRMSDEYLKKIKKIDPYSRIFTYPMKNLRGIVTYEDPDHMMQYLYGFLKNHIDSKKIFIRAEF